MKKTLTSLTLSSIAAVAVANAIENNAGVEAKIKWVNDIFLNDKKVCGILTEGTTDIENGQLKYVVLGMGINVFPPDGSFPDEIKNIASSVFEESMHDKDYRSKIIADIITNLMKMYPELSKKGFFEEYKKRSFLLGKTINIIRKDYIEEAKALDIDESFGLIVEKKDSSVEIHPVHTLVTKQINNELLIGDSFLISEENVNTKYVFFYKNIGEDTLVIIESNVFNDIEPKDKDKGKNYNLFWQTLKFKK